jgi:hypothetical protein
LGRLEFLSLTDLILGEGRIHMAQQTSSHASALASAAAHAFKGAMDWLCNLIGEQRKVYRPEAYYMRGPGPRWREKHLQGRDIAL